MSEANILMTPITRKVTAYVHCLFSNSEGGVACGKTASVSGLKDMVFRKGSATLGYIAHNAHDNKAN